MLAAQQQFANSMLLAMQQQQHEQQHAQQPRDHQSDMTQKHGQDALLHQQPSGPWSSEEYEMMMRSIFDAAPNTAAFGDVEAPPSFGSFAASHSGSYMSSSSDNGASPASFNDFVYGAQNFPTPPESDISIASRHMSLSAHPNNGLSPNDSIDFQQGVYSASFAGSDTTSPYSRTIPIPPAPSSSPFGTQQLPFQPQMFQNAPVTAETLAAVPNFARSGNAQWDPNFLMPNMPPTMSATQPALQPQHSAPSFPTSQAEATTTAGVPSAKQAASNPMASIAGNSTTAPAAAAPSEDVSTRQTKKLKSTGPTKELPSETAVPVASTSAISSKLPHMEVGSNATALAAIQRLKAKRLQEREEAAKAAGADAAMRSENLSASPTRSDGSDKPELTPAMRQQKKVAHNAIERRYRNNINDRIAALRRAVPALREIRPRKTPSGRKSRKALQEEDLVDGVPAATKLNKATILGKATDYIKYLKSRELRLASEVAGLRELVRSLEGGEELLELWEAEMDKVVAEQEAAAAAAAAREEEDEGIVDDIEGDAEDDEDEDEQDDYDTSHDASQNSGSSASPPSQRGSRSNSSGRQGKAGFSSVASSRYMLATFLGISFIGGGAEFALDSTASDASQAVARPATGRVVVGASRQLLKRSAAYVAPSSNIVQIEQAYEHVPSHILALEILRVVSFGACFLFLVWPLLSGAISRFTSRRVRAVPSFDESDTPESRDPGRRELLRVLATPSITPIEADIAMRKYLGATQSVIAAVPKVFQECLIFGFSKIPFFRNVAFKQQLAADALDVQVRLLELEAIASEAAQPAFVLRLHNALQLANYRSNLETLSATPVTTQAWPGRAQTFGSLAVAFARLGEGVDAAQDVADDCWTRARRAMLASVQSGGTDASDSSGDLAQKLQKLSDPTWLSTILALDLDTALELLASATHSTDVKRASCLHLIADTYYGNRLETVWNTLLCNIVDASCPTADTTASSLLRGFASRQSAQKLVLDVVQDDSARTQLHLEITMLARTAHPSSTAWYIAQVTLATWSAVLGNVALARHVASTLTEHVEPSPNSDLACIAVLKQFVNGATYDGAALTLSKGALDARATLFLSWLQFLRLFARQGAETGEIHSASLRIRRLISAATASSTSLAQDDEVGLEDMVEAKLDLLTDLCVMISRRTAHLPSGNKTDFAKVLLESDGEDSGIGF
ncbi:hypothetical protein BCV70DRAFT_157545 [Testicularia cyperi]|uniref:BHLH domain-containing protein n=1 Tax=Testicularia cyperi TaxID=1882483 RepID=A0A317XVX0_9BASI|nr:hypothetical protein BCV70DRAFT_157545 [Testicularia cyperi]